MILIDGVVYCEAIDELHPPDDLDPQEEGPRRAFTPDEYQEFIENDAWSFTERPRWPGEYWHFTCPGPHFNAWRGAEVDVGSFG